MKKVLKRACILHIIYGRVFAHGNYLSHFGEPRCLAISGVEGSIAGVEVKQPEVYLCQ